MLFRHHSHFVSAGIAAAALGFGMLTVTSWAQDTASEPVSQNGSDTEVAAQVKQALQFDSHLNSRHIDVAMQHGDVVLTGFVQDNRDLLSATQIATKAASGHKIVNHLSIKQNYPNAP
jgi:osmotically-inducible protein OsmY